MSDPKPDDMARPYPGRHHYVIVDQDEPSKPLGMLASIYTDDDFEQFSFNRTEGKWHVNPGFAMPFFLHGDSSTGDLMALNLSDEMAQKIMRGWDADLCDFEAVEKADAGRQKGG